MTKTILTTLVAGALYVGLGCTSSEPLSPLAVDRPSFLQAPGDGNGSKNVFPLDLLLPDFTTCADGTTLSLRLVGWEQIRSIGEGPGTIQTLNYEFIYSNAAGETYVWHQVGAGRVYLSETGDRILSAGGRFGYDPIVGHFVVNLTTGELVSIAGRAIFAEDLACAALT
jgi:hypothetical protein